MYNGIGLSTVRGTATSGHVTGNASYVKPQFVRNLSNIDNANSKHRSKSKNTSINSEIMDHNKKREIEAKLFEYRVKLEDEGLDEDTVETKITEMREKKLKQQEKNQLNINIKNNKDKRLRDAFNIDDDVKEGDAFNKEIQEQRKQARIEKRSKDQQEREEKLLLQKAADEAMKQKDEIESGQEDEGEEEEEAVVTEKEEPPVEVESIEEPAPITKRKKSRFEDV